MKMLRKKDCCGCGDWKSQIKELWMKYQSVVKGIKAGPDTVYPDGDGIADIDGAIENEVARQISAESLVTQSDLSEAIADFATADQLDTGLATVAAARQDKLVNQLNIKSINGVSMLGSGDMHISADSVAWDNVTDKPEFAEVATSGSYEDLTDKPTIPAAQVNADWNADSGVAQILNKPTLAAVATSGDYDDLTDKPTIPSGTDLVPSTSGVTDGYVLTNDNGTPAWKAGGGGGGGMTAHTYATWGALVNDMIAHPNFILTIENIVARASIGSVYTFIYYDYDEYDVGTPTTLRHSVLKGMTQAGVSSTSLNFQFGSITFNLTDKTISASSSGGSQGKNINQVVLFY